MNKIKFDDPVFPDLILGDDPNEFPRTNPGISIGALFSAIAMQGFISNRDFTHSDNMNETEVAHFATLYADALIEKLNERK